MSTGIFTSKFNHVCVYHFFLFFFLKKSNFLFVHVVQKLTRLVIIAFGSTSLDGGVSTYSLCGGVLRDKDCFWKYFVGRWGFNL